MIPLLLFLLGCVTVYVGAIEAAFSALMRLSLRLMAERNGKGEGLARYLDEPILLFLPIRLLLGVTFALATVLLAALIFVEGERESWHGLALLLLSVGGFILVTEHVVPLFIVRRDPERVLDVLLPPFEVWVRLLSPITAALVRMATWTRDRHGVTTVEPSGEPAGGEQVEALLEAGEREELIESEERKLLQSIVDFGDTLVREVMTPRPDIVAIKEDATLDELRALFREQEYSRIPAYTNNLDNIVGFVFVKDLIQLTDTPGQERPITNLLRPAYFVPETKRVAELLKEFQRHQVQLAIVVDEYGGTAGLVTMEDLIEEIVGEIRDEYDVESEPIVDEGNGAFLFSGKVDIDEVGDRLGIEIERQGFETVGGYLLSRLGRVPAVGEVVEVDGLHIQVLEAERRRVHKVRITRQAQETLSH